MNFYPAWNLPGVNGGLLIAVISVLHLFVAQLAVGGGFLLVMAERKGHAENSLPILNWVKNHTKFFLLLTMVFGGLSGVGIWFIVSLVSPSGLSLLVREFLFAWATEWAFFFGEIVALLVYQATFTRCLTGDMTAKDHMFIGFCYGAFAFLSLFTINGVVSFMLTPGAWLTSGNFWDGIFNPSFWPALVYRFLVSLLLGGLFALCTASAIKEEPARLSVTRFAALWVALPAIALPLASWWYYQSLDPAQQAMILRHTSDIRPMLTAFIIITPLMLPAGLAFMPRLRPRVQFGLSLCIMLIALAQVGVFEWVRETGRRPWLIYNYMYSNGVLASEVDEMLADGSAGHLFRPAHVKPEDTAQSTEIGKFIFGQQCSGCHGLGAPALDLVPRVSGRGVEGICALLTGQGKLRTYMPPFLGTEAEKMALARYLDQATAKIK